MLVSCWSAKGGAGTSVIAAALALVLAERHPSGILLADLAGDQPAVLGSPEPGGPGLAGWAAAGDEAPAEGLRRLEVEVADGLHLLPRGDGPIGEAALERLADELLLDPRPAVVDTGVVCRARPGAVVVAARATVSLLVVRPCYLALRHATRAPIRPSGVVVVDEPHRALDERDVEDVLDVPVVAVVRVDPAIARAVDAGLLAHRLPRQLARALACAA